MDIQDLDKVDDNNQQNWPEGTMQVKQVNNAGRADEGLLARWFSDWNGSKTTAGTSAALTLTSDTKPSAYYNGFTVWARLHVTADVGATLNVDSLGADPIKKNGGNDLQEGDLPSQTIGIFVHDGGTPTGSWTLTTLAIANVGTTAGDLVGVQDIGGNDGIPSSLVVGTLTNDDAAAGYVGEYVESAVEAGAAVALTNATPVNITSISLAAGDWDIDASFLLTGQSSTNLSYLLGSVSQTTGALDSSAATLQGDWYGTVQVFNNISPVGLAMAPVRKSLSGTTTIFMVAQAGFTGGTCSGYGIIRARRVR